MLDLTGKVALVSGGSRGIGRGIVLRLAQQGAAVVFTYQSNAAAADEVVAAISATGGKAQAVQGDVRDMDAATAAVKAATSTFGRLDILVNNAGTTRDTLLPLMKEEDWDIVLDTNLKGPYHLTKAALRPMLRQKSGRIINITSVAGVVGNPGQANYSAAKAGLIGFTKSVAKEIGSRGITVNAVAPGYIPTDLTSDLPSELIEGMVGLSALKRLGTVEDVANLVAYLASDEANYITGQVISVDGGLAM
ncbi:MAG: 3-oxoacyl-[acyl-carrier-protein] reductase [Anaerolineae bacterium]